jgi:hypothetical protein
MENIKTYDNFPRSLVLFTIFVTASIYVVGAGILYGFGPAMTALYLLFAVGNEIHVMKKNCVDCYYYGKWCSFGRGKLAALLFPQGDPKRFIAKRISWIDLLPDMLVLVFPLVGGSALLIQRFSWGLTMLIALFLGLALGGNYAVRSRIACTYCRQRELGCPAEQFFDKP